MPTTEDPAVLAARNAALTGQVRSLKAMLQEAQRSQGQLQGLSEETVMVPDVVVETGRREVERLNRIVAALEVSLRQETEKSGLVALQDAQITKLRERCHAAEQRVKELEALLHAAGGNAVGEEAMHLWAVDVEEVHQERMELEKKIAAAFGVAKQNEMRAQDFGKQLKETQQVLLLTLSNAPFERTIVQHHSN